MKNKGFTLIELLAVIVILAIIAVIAVPKILNVVDEAKKSSAEASALGYIDAVEKYVLLNGVDNVNYPYDLKGKTLDVSTETNGIPGINAFLKTKGEKPSRGTVTLNEKGKVTNARLTLNGYSIICQNDRCTVAGTPGSLSSISVKTMPTKTTYTDTSELLDLTGLEIEATYGDGTTLTLSSSDFVTSPANNTALTKLGNNQITVSYTANGATKTTSFNVVVERMAIPYSASNTLDYKGYNGDLNDYISTTRIDTSGTNNRANMNNTPWIALPNGVEGYYLNIKYMLDQYYSHLEVAFYDETRTLIGKNHSFYNRNIASYNNASVGSTVDSLFVVEDINDNNVLLTGKLEIPEGTKYVLMWKNNSDHGAKIYDTYITAN